MLQSHSSDSSNLNKLKPLAIVAIVGLLSVGVATGTATIAYAASCTSGGLSSPGGYGGGDGSSGDPFQISSQAQLVLLAETSADHDKSFIQTSDIALDLSSCDWVPIGALGGSSSEFQGSYNGGNKAISGFSTSNISLFNDVKGPSSANPASVKNVSLRSVVATNFNQKGILADDTRYALIDSVEIDGTMSVAQGVTGSLVGTAAFTTISNSSANIAITVPTGEVTIGGLVGKMESSSELINSSTSGSIGGFGQKVGGLVGELALGTVIRQSSSSMTMSTANTRQEIGGLVGELDGEIRYSFSTGNITGKAFVGGLVGLMDRGTVADSFNLGDISVTQPDNSSSSMGGGLVGDIEDGSSHTLARSYSIGAVGTSTGRADDLGALAGTSGARDISTNYLTVADNYWDTSATSQTLGIARATGSADDKVTGLSTSGMTSFETFDAAGWAIVDGWAPFNAPVSGNPDPDVHSVWGICSGVNDGYPFLLWQYTSDPCSGSSSSESSAGVPGIFLYVAGPVGRTVGHSPVYYGADRVAAASEYEVRVLSTSTRNPMVASLASGELPINGSLPSTLVRLPQLEPGTYLVRMTGKHTTGKTLELTAQITVGPNGTFTAIGPNIPIIR